MSTHLSDHFQARQARLWRRPDARLEAWEPELLRGHSPWPDLPLARQMALGHERPVHLGSQVGRAYYPLPAGSSGAVVLELQLDQPATELHQQLANEMLRVARNVVGLLDDSERDPLTGLLNRKTFDETFMRMADLGQAQSATVGGQDGRRHWQSDDPCYLGVVDIDHFKRVNDRCGHLVGDEVLLLVARLMAETLRQHDRVYRFGGEEFVVLLSCREHAGAWAALERLRQRIESHSFPQTGPLTVSIGFTSVRSDDTPEQAFGRADLAVYAAKAGGRNQVREFDAPSAGDAPPEAGAGAASGVEYFL
mgnify:CR=1 FL=1